MYSKHLKAIRKWPRTSKTTFYHAKRIYRRILNSTESKCTHFSQGLKSTNIDRNDDRIKFEKVMHRAIVSALLPMSIPQDSKMNSDDEDEPTNTKISMLAVQRTNVELFKRTTEICEATAGLLTLYSGLKRLDISGGRIVKSRKELQDDRKLAQKMIKAGAMNTKLHVQATLASRSIATQLSPSMSEEEAMNAKRFEGQGEVDASSSEQHGVSWDMFTQSLTDNVREIEKLVDHE